MGSAAGWLEHNWFSFLQCIGIVGGLLFTAFSLREHTKSRKTSIYLSLVEQHRELWSEVHQRADLKRVLSHEADFLAMPMTSAEREFLNVAIVHFNTGWLLSRETSLLSKAAMKHDVRSFFNLPLARSVWNDTKTSRDPAFVKYVERTLADS